MNPHRRLLAFAVGVRSWAPAWCSRSSACAPSIRCPARRSAFPAFNADASSLLSPILLRGETIVWQAVPIFAAVGLVFPGAADAADLRRQPRARPGAHRCARQSRAAVRGGARRRHAGRAAAAGAVRRPRGLVLGVACRHRHPHAADCATGGPGRCCCRSARRCCAASIPPVIKIGLEIWPSPIAAGLIGYIFSTLTVLTVERIRTGALHRRRRRCPAGCGLPLTASATASARFCSTPRSAPGRWRWWRRWYATYPLVTVGLSTLVLGNVRRRVHGSRPARSAHGGRRRADPDRAG